MPERVVVYVDGEYATLFIVTPSEDTRKCKVEILQTSATPGALTVTCNDYSVVLVVRLVS